MDTPGMFQTRSQAIKAFAFLAVCVAVDLCIAAAIIWGIYVIVGGLTS